MIKIYLEIRVYFNRNTTDFFVCLSSGCLTSMDVLRFLWLSCETVRRFPASLLNMRAVCSEGDILWTWCEWPPRFQPIHSRALLHWWMSQCHPQGWEREEGNTRPVYIPTMDFTWKVRIYTHTHNTSSQTHTHMHSKSQHPHIDARRSQRSVTATALSIPLTPTLPAVLPPSPTLSTHCPPKFYPSPCLLAPLFSPGRHGHA